MPPSQPWRDIPSAAAVQQELSRLNIEDNLQRFGVLDGGKAAKQRTSLKTRLYADVAHYHRVPKDRLSTLMPREAMLRGIAASASALWANAGGRATQMGPTIASLADRAIQKANYLRKLYDFYKGEGAGVFRGQDLLNFLKSPPHASGGHLANLQRGCRLERIDPAHRSSEVHLDPSTPFNLDSFNCGMNWAFAEWCGALMQAPGGDANDITVRKNFTVNDIDAASLPPFFLWLEKHRICVGSDTDAFGGTFGFSPAELTGVLFSPYGQASRAGGGPSRPSRESIGWSRRRTACSWKCLWMIPRVECGCLTRCTFPEKKERKKRNSPRPTRGRSVEPFWRANTLQGSCITARSWPAMPSGAPE